ncbi:hypothetical protein ACFDR9_004819 [Janthinobacterium sp. CG_23.3]|nr:hypothetical protein [Janthinobacterium sp. CG_S6]
MDMYQYRRDRLLALLRDQYGNMRKNIADASGWSEARMSQILSPTYRDGRAFSEKIARKLEADLAIETMYFDQGAAPAEAAPLPGLRPVVVAEIDDERFCAIRKVRLCLSAGITGFSIEPESYDGSMISVPRTWVERNGFQPERLVAIKVKGESMEPALFQDDVVIINTADTQPADGVVFAVNYEGEAVVKRLARDIGQWWLTSDNPDQRKYHRKMCRGNECLIVGRVVRKESDRI